MPEPTPVPPFRYRLPADVATRIRATRPRSARRFAALVLATGVLGGAYAVSIPSGQAQAMRKDCGPTVVLDISEVPQTVENSNC